MTTDEAIKILECFFRESDNECKNFNCERESPECKFERECALEMAIAALRRAQPANEPLTPEDQWMETASDNTDCVLAYADGIYCVTDADGHVICEFIRKPEPEGRENDGPTI